MSMHSIKYGICGYCKGTCFGTVINIYEKLAGTIKDYFKITINWIVKKP